MRPSVKTLEKLNGKEIAPRGQTGRTVALESLAKLSELISLDDQQHRSAIFNAA
jgi:hypothetical protein